MEVLPFFLAIAAVAVVVAVLGARAERRRREALAAWAAGHGLTLEPGKDANWEERFPPFACLREGDRRHATNRMEGQRDGRRVTAFDYHYVTYTQSKHGRQAHHHTFSAVIVDAGLPLYPLRIRTEGLFDRMAGFLGFDDIDFEHAAFSREFHVSAPDRRWAFDVLHQATIEWLLESPRFTIELGGPWVLARRSGRFDAEAFGQAVAVAEGILQRLPRYVRWELEGADS